MTDEIEISLIGNWDPDECFEMEEAVSLLHQEVIRIEDREYLPSPPIEAIGIVCGVLTMNEEIEIIVRFMDDMEQLNKRDLYSKFIVVEEH